ncbi:MAG TPA: sigma-70 family RNA polymerase sigma factor [Acidimicrobiales bacterium]|nr:sigma-70 family RNA polymerase sigma factor [Acidimicrobiales bacterium]
MDEPAVAIQGKSSFVEFYQSEYVWAVRLVWGLQGSSSSSEDFVQEAFLRVYRRFEDLEIPRGFLRVTLVNLWRDAQRKGFCERRKLQLVGTPDSISNETRELLDVLEQLPYRQRATLVLRYWADFTEADIAEALQCRPGTVKALASRGLHQLRKALES